MQSLSESLILLNGEPKTSQIDSIVRYNAQVYRIYFKNNPKFYYTYTLEKVVWFSNPRRLDPELHKVYYRNTLQSDITEILRFEMPGMVYWRIKYKRGHEIESPEGVVKVFASCLDDNVCKTIFGYVQSIAAINPLGKENGQGILSAKYEAISFLDDRTATACYLNPKKYPVKGLRHKDLIYPFGLNQSQKRAVERAFEHQISVIQGPPGTGKTQTILNIIANIVKMGKTVMVVSNNNSAIANVWEKLKKYELSFIVASLGSNENKAEFFHNQPSIPANLDGWLYSSADCMAQAKELHFILERLNKVFSLQNEQAELKQQREAIGLEWKHFCQRHRLEEDAPLQRVVKSSRLMRLWLQCQLVTKGDSLVTDNSFAAFKHQIKRLWLYLICKYVLRLRHKFRKNSLISLETELQKLYYQNYHKEIEYRLEEIKQELASYDTNGLMKKVSKDSMNLFRASLYDKYKSKKSARGLFSLETVESLFWSNTP